MRRKLFISVGVLTVIVLLILLWFVFGYSPDKYVTIQFTGYTTNSSIRYARFQVSNHGSSMISIGHWIFERPEHTNVLEFSAPNHESQRRIQIPPDHQDYLTVKAPSVREEEPWRCLIGYEVLNTRNDFVHLVRRKLPNTLLERLPLALTGQESYLSPSDWIKPQGVAVPKSQLNFNDR